MGWSRRERLRILREVKVLAACNSCATIMASPLTEEECLESLQSTFPTATQEEVKRFWKARKKNVRAAEEKLREFMEWRERHGLDNDANRSNSCADEQDWAYAAGKALSWAQTQPSEKKGKNRRRTPETTTLPQIVMVYSNETEDICRDRSGHIVLHVIPAVVDKKLASSETYALAMALYLDRKFSRSSFDLATICLDVRPGEGWPNPPAYNMMPFIHACTKMLHQLYPERLHQCIIFPLPRAALWIWEMAKPFLDTAIVEATQLIAGSDRLRAPPPNEQLAVYVEEDLLDRMETKRLSKFLK